MIYLFLGEPSPAKEQDIARIRDKLMPDLQMRVFDYDALDGHKLDSSQLKQSLIALPALAAKRLVLIRNANKLTGDQEDLLREFGLASFAPEILLDWNGAAAKGLVKKCGGSVKVFAGDVEKKDTVFDMTRLLPHRPGEALKILNQLYADGQHPVQILGALVWFWGTQRGKISMANYTKGLLELQEADMRVKRSRLRPEQAIEVAVLKLCLLITS